MRTLSPTFRTLPSSTCDTLSALATSHTFTDRPLNVNAVLRAMTSSADTFDRSVVMSSQMPSLKYSCSGSPLMFWNGSTHTDSAPDVSRAFAGAFASGAPASSFKLAHSFRHPCASVSGCHSCRSAQWIWLNGIGGMVPSIVAWTRVSAPRAVSASARTHCDLTASQDHSTTTAAAPRIRSSITSA